MTRTKYEKTIRSTFNKMMKMIIYNLLCNYLVGI